MRDRAIVRKIDGVWVVARPRIGFGPVPFETQPVPSQAAGIKWLNTVAKAPKPKGSKSNG